jgi:hypothetical protein
MFVNRTHGVVATTLGVLALGACANPEQNTDLRPEGPPDVLAVLVMTDAAGHLAEHATFCKQNDPKRPSLVGLPDATTSQICPEELGEAADPVTDAYPDGWYVRIMFDELLDPQVEELSEIVDDDGAGTGTFTGSIANTQPVKLECQNLAGAFVEVEYDGYYSPAGNNVTWPLGPSLVIKPNDPTLIATGHDCRVTINAGVVADKDGTEVPADQRGPYTFSIAEITPLATDPTDSQDSADPVLVDALAPYFDNFYFQFNTDVQKSSFCADTDFAGTFAKSFTDAVYGAGQCDEGTENFTITPAVSTEDAGGFWGYCNATAVATGTFPNVTAQNPDYCSTAADCPAGSTRCEAAYVYTYNGLNADDEIGIGYNTPLKTDTTYTFALKPGTKLKDRCGAETTVPTASSENLYAITFKTNKFDFKSVSIVTGETAAPAKKPNIRFNTVVDASSLAASEYTLTPTPNGATLGQFSGGELIVGGNFALDTEYTLTIKAGATVTDWYGATWTNDADKVITWKTSPKLLLTSSTADNSVLQKTAVQQLIGPSITWNANMDHTTLTADEWSIVDATTMQPVTVAISKGAGSAGSGNNCTATSQGCQTRFRADFAPGDYIFTLKAGATVSDRLGNVYTQEADRVVHFTVAAPAPAVQCL